jgi:hypothetical protein
MRSFNWEEVVYKQSNFVLTYLKISKMILHKNNRNDCICFQLIFSYYRTHIMASTRVHSYKDQVLSCKSNSLCNSSFSFNSMFPHLKLTYMNLLSNSNFSCNSQLSHATLCSLTLSSHTIYSLRGRHSRA